MSESLPLEQFVAQQLASGRYQSYDELVEEALRLLLPEATTYCAASSGGSCRGGSRLVQTQGALPGLLRGNVLRPRPHQGGGARIARIAFEGITLQHGAATA